MLCPAGRHGIKQILPTPCKELSIGWEQVVLRVGGLFLYFAGCDIAQTAFFGHFTRVGGVQGRMKMGRFVAADTNLSI